MLDNEDKVLRTLPRYPSKKDGDDIRRTDIHSVNFPLLLQPLIAQA
jgi:hypothetical protein